MAGAIGLMECAEVDVGTTGTPSGTMVAIDKVLSGTMDYEGGEIIHSEGIGGQDCVFRGMITPIGNVETMVQTLTLLNCVVPASVGALPPVIAEIQGGVVGDSTLARKHSDCYISECKLSCAQGGELRAAYAWKALGEAAATIASAATKQANSPIVWHAGSVLIDGSAYKCLSWEATATNDIVACTSLDAKTAGVQRLVEWIDPGNFSVKLSFTVRVPLATDLLDDWPDAIEFVFTGDDIETSPKTFTLDLSGGSALHLTKQPLPLVVGSEAVVLACEAEGVLNDLSVWDVSFT